MKVGFIAGLMVMALAGSAGASAPVRAITDTAGDANGLANNPTPLQVDASTPASDAAMDITEVSLWRDHTALNVRFALSGAPDQTMPQAMYTLTSSAAPCPTRFVVFTGGPNAPSLTGAIDNRSCIGGWVTTGVTAAADGSSVVLRLPFSALHASGFVSSPGEVIGGLTAQTRLGTYVVVSEPQAQGFLTDQIGPLLDATGTGSDYTIPEDDSAG